MGTVTTPPDDGHRYESAGCRPYWVSDPDGPNITTWELRDDEYVQSGHASGEEKLEVTAPYDVTITPTRLLV